LCRTFALISSSVSSSTPKPIRWSSLVVKWSRRLSAFLLYALVLCRLFGGKWPFGSLFAVNPILFGLASRDLAVSAGICWYAFLAQLKIRWMLALPAYLIFFPPAFMLWKGSVLAFRPLAEGLNSAVANGTPHRGSISKVPWKRVWVLLFFIWLIALRTVPTAWVSWLPPLLLVPIWLWLLRIAYSSATAPAVVADKALALCSAALDGIAKQQQPEGTSGVESAKKLNRWVSNAVRRLLKRYSADKVAAVVHREALLVFSLALLLTIAMSAVFWGLCGRALHETSPNALSGYHFFSSYTLGECTLWAFGCMTTSISFPGQETSTGVKGLHAAILATGLFQITYLLACFSIMASAVVGETANKTILMAKALSDRLHRESASAIVVGEVIEAKAATALEGEQAKTDSPQS
jgi:hypothetical protein